MELKKAQYKAALLNDPDWRPVPDYENLYEIHWRGVVRNKTTKENLRAGKTLNGYMTVALYKNKKGHSFTVHRIVCKAFLQNEGNREMVNHKDSNRANNHISNLEWATRSENTIHALKLGRMVPPSKSTQITQYDLDGNFIREYSSLVELKKCGFGNEDVLHCCKGHRDSYRGYKWTFKTNKSICR